MHRKASITVLRPQHEVERLWSDPSSASHDLDASVTFTKAPGDRGTEIHLELNEGVPAGKLGEAVLKLAGTDPLAKAKDQLRRFKQLVETGVIARSDSTPEGEQLESKLRQRPAQPVEDIHREKAGV
jgi:uncharacterized membrane protein